MQRFRVSATGHSLNYLPEYVATWKGFFAEEGLAVTATVPSPWDRVLDELHEGSADAALGGVWVPSMFHGRARRYTPFAQVANRAPLAVLGRESAEDFAWSNLIGRTVSMKGSNGASVGLYVKLVLRENGIDPASVNFVQDLDGAMLSTLFAGGLGDYLVIDHPSALALAATGGGTTSTGPSTATGGRGQVATTINLVAPLAISTADIPWSVYYAEGDSDETRLQTQVRFMRALGRAMDWINDHDATGYRDFLTRTFPAFDADLLVHVANQYRAHRMWTTPEIDRAGYDRWQHGIAGGHLTQAPIAYDTLVDARPARSLLGAAAGAGAGAPAGAVAAG